MKFKINGGDKEKALMVSADETGFTIAKKGEDVRFEYNNISKVKTYFEWNKAK